MNNNMVDSIDRLRVSIVMPAYNAAPFLRQAVDSILSQTFTDFEFIVVDDGSTDSTLAILDGYSDPRIRVIKSEHNLGLPGALNLGLSAARGEYIARMDADDVSLPERLMKQVSWLDENPETSVLGTFSIRIDPQGRYHEFIPVPTGDKEISRRLLSDANPIIHGSVMMRSVVVQKVGGYRDIFPMQRTMISGYELWMLELSEIFPIPYIFTVLIQVKR